MIPVKPELSIEARDDGGICLDRASSSDLAIYISELERIALK